MLATYSDYIRRFVHNDGLGGNQCPGEHHFVSVFLLPLLYSINRIVPDYVNPDGTKRLIGDVVYFRDGAHHYGIEVKFGTVRLTKTEFNNWIVAKQKNKHPDVFIGVGRSGLLVLSWSDFRDLYMGAVRDRQATWKPKRIKDGYGPQKSVDVLCGKQVADSCFEYFEDPTTAASEQARLMTKLAELLAKLSTLVV